MINMLPRHAISQILHEGIRLKEKRNEPNEEREIIIWHGKSVYMVQCIRSVGCRRIIFYFIKSASLKMTAQVFMRKKRPTIQKNICLCWARTWKSCHRLCEWKNTFLVFHPFCQIWRLLMVSLCRIMNKCGIL